MSNILTNNINPRSGNVINIGGINDKVSIAGTLSYEDVSNIDSVGVITARSGIHVTGVGSSVGIGTDNPVRSLDIQAPNNENIPLVIRSGPNQTTGFIAIKDPNTTGDFNNRIGSEGDNLLLWSNGGERLRINSSGNVGIGTDNPQHDIHLYRNGDATLFIQADADNVDEDHNPKISMSQDGQTTSIFDIGLNGTAGAEFSNALANTAYIHSVSNATSNGIQIATNGDARITVDNDGRVLVGTSTARTNFHNSNNNPYQFQIEGTTYNNSAPAFISNSTTASHGPHVTMARSRGSDIGSNGLLNDDDVVGVLNWQGNDGGQFVNCARIRCFVDGTAAADEMPGRLTFETTAPGGSNTTERMSIDSSGHLLLGDSSRNVQIFYNNSNGASTQDFNRPNTTSSSTAMRFRNSGTIIGTITYTNTSAAFNTGSDYRLKENVVPLTGAADRVNQLQVHRFNFIADPSKTVDGFIAHEAQAVVPEAVTGTHNEVDDEGNPVYQGIDQSKLVPLLTAALQEAFAKIETLESQNADLLTRVSALEG